MLEFGNMAFLIMAVIVLVAIGVTVLAIARHDNRRINRELRKLEEQRRHGKTHHITYNAKHIEEAMKHDAMREQRRRRGEGQR